MKLQIDKYDPACAFANLDPEEEFTDNMRGKAVHYAQEHGCKYVEVYRLDAKGHVRCVWYGETHP